MTTKTRTWEDYLDSAREDAREAWEEGTRDAGEAAANIADRNTPVYYGELWRLASQSNDLAFAEIESSMLKDTFSAADALQVAAFLELERAVYDEFDRLEEAAKETA